MLREGISIDSSLETLTKAKVDETCLLLQKKGGLQDVLTKLEMTVSDDGFDCCRGREKKD